LARKEQIIGYVPNRRRLRFVEIRLSRRSKGACGKRRIWEAKQYTQLLL